MRRFALFFLPILLTTCTASAPAKDLTPTSTASTSMPKGRYGTFNIPQIHSSGISGTFIARDNGDGTTSLSIQLTPAADLNPWGIFNIVDCVNGVPENTRPIFTLADIENGQKEEPVETDAYKSAQGNLFVVVYGISPDGSQQMVACADLGSALVDANASPSTPTPDCTSQTISTPQLDSGSWIAYSASVNNNSDIYVLNVDSFLQGQNPIPKRLTTNPATDFDPTWSPDGRHIAFRSQRDGNDEIYIMNADGTCQTNLTNNPLGAWSPAWSADGKQIAFARFFDNNQFTDVAVINADGSGLQRLTHESGEYPAWSPDGTRIAFASAREGNYEIYVMNADGTGQTRLTKNPAYDMSPTWSPDGTQIAFDTQRDGYPPVENGIGPEFEIHVMTADGSNDMRLTDNTAEDRFPSRGANDLIAFTRNGALFIMNSDGKNQIKLLDGAGFPAWRPVLSLP